MEHWAVRMHRVKYIQQELNSLKVDINKNFSISDISLTVKLSRISPRSLDYDNLVFAFKPVRDKIAHIFFPNSKMGQYDTSKYFNWIYSQEKGAPQEYSITIEII